MADKPSKKPFVSQADRPEVRLKSDTRLSDLTVRDLATILGQLGTRKDFWDGKDWQKDDFDGQNKPWKESKEFKDGKEVKEQGDQGVQGRQGEARDQGAEGREARARRRLRPAVATRPTHRAGDPRALWPVCQGRPARRPDRGAARGQGLSPGPLGQRSSATSPERGSAAAVAAGDKPGRHSGCAFGTCCGERRAVAVMEVATVHPPRTAMKLHLPKASSHHPQATTTR